jgi:hypothetical protein
MAQTPTVLSFKPSSDLRARLDALQARMAARNPDVTISTSDVLRRVFTAGLDALEREIGPTEGA